MDYKDYYKVLGVSENASKEEIRRAYKKLAKKYHPDQNQDEDKSDSKFKEINEAYEVLKNPEKRKKFDDLKNGNFKGYEGSFSSRDNGFAGGSYSGFYGESANDFSDFFNQFFGGMNNTNEDYFSQRSDTMNLDIETTMEISLEEGYHGGSKTVRLKSEEGEKTLKINIPKGVKSGTKIKLQGQGKAHPYKRLKGNLYITLKIQNSDSMELEGKNIIKEMEVTPWEAALDERITFHHFGEKLALKIPPGTQSGNKLKLKGKGYHSKSGEPGDLYVVITIKNPPRLSKDEINLYEQLKKISEYKPNR